MKKDSKIKKLLSDTIVFAVGNASSKVILFLLVPLYTSILTTSEFGIADNTIVIVELLVPVISLSIYDAVLRFSIDSYMDKKVIFSIGMRYIIKAISLMTLLCLVVYVVIKNNYIIFLYLVYVSYTMKQMFGSFLRGIGRPGLFSFTGFMGTVILVLLNVFFLRYLHLGINGYLISIALSNGFSAVFMFVYARLDKYLLLHVYNKELEKGMLNYSIPLIPNTIAWWLNNTVSRMMILLFLGIETMGIYSAASKIPAVINILVNVFQQAWIYSSSKVVSDSDRGDFYNKVFVIFTSFVAIAATSVIFVLPYITKFILRGDFYTATSYIPYMILSSSLASISVYFGGLFGAVKKNQVLMISTLVGTLINIIINSVLINYIGIYSVLIGNFIGYFITIVIRAKAIRNYLEFDINLARVALYLIIITFQAIYTSLNLAYTSYISGVCVITIFILCLSLIYNNYKASNDLAKTR